MKRVLREISRPVKQELFEQLFIDEEMVLMRYLYIDKIHNQAWISDEMGISLPTLTALHNRCVEQLISYYNYQKYKHDHNEDSLFSKYFNLN
jgi:hypothetical protein